VALAETGSDARDALDMLETIADSNGEVRDLLTDVRTSR
jgi:hypothetical protein